MNWRQWWARVQRAADRARVQSYIDHYERVAEAEAHHLSQAITMHTDRRIAALNLVERYKQELQELKELST